MIPKREVRLAAIAVMLIALASPVKAGSQPGTSQLLVTSQNSSGQTIGGYYTILYQNGNSVATSFTPASFTMDDGLTYVVQVDDYDGCYFQHWADTGSTSASRTITIYTDTQIAAVYGCGGSKSSVTISSVEGNGGAIFGYHTVLYNSTGGVVSTGFTTQTFPTVAGKSYSVRADSYGSCTFGSWSNGMTANPMPFTATSGSLAFTAVYNCGVVSTGPALVQEAQSTCSFECPSGSTETTFSSDVRSGDTLVVTVAEDNLGALTVSDSLGTTIQLATRYTNSSCTGAEPNGTCQAAIFYGVLAASGPDSVTVGEAGSDSALRVQAWEFSGVNSVAGTGECSPYCSSAAYPPRSVLLATASYVTGPGPGFAWYQYAASAVAGSEYRITSSAGSTTFPFMVYTLNEEAAVVLSPSFSTITVSTVSSNHGSIRGYYITLWQGGSEIGSCFSTCSFTVNDGQTYQVEAASYGAEHFSHWQNDGAAGKETVDVPETNTTISLTAVYSP